MAWCAQPLSDSPRGCPLGTPRLAGIDRQPGSLGRSQGYTVHSLSNKQKCIARCVLLSVCWQLALASAAQESLAETGLTQGHVRSTLAVGDHNALFAQEVSWKEAYEYCQEHVMIFSVCTRGQERVYSSSPPYAQTTSDASISCGRTARRCGGHSRDRRNATFLGDADTSWLMLCLRLNPRPRVQVL